MKYDTTIGLEVHVQMNTNTKAFSGDANSFGDDPNTHISAVSMALPGALPRTNALHVNAAVKLGIALNSAINQVTSFDRKNYFYPDSPKGYQITQNEKPILVGGQFTFTTEGTEKTIRIHQVHMEDDAGKSIHDLSDTRSMIDLNRAGTPLLEIVTEPDFETGQEVSDFLAALQILVRYIDISDANMEEGSMRCDCNVSIKPAGQKELGTRCEIKNINSKKFAKTAIKYERQRQINLVEKGATIDQETRLFDAKKGVTFTMRKKEDALDYRYFPDPDLQNIHITDSHIKKLKEETSLLPWTAKKQLIEEHGVSERNAINLAIKKNYVLYFIALNDEIKQSKLVSNFILNHIAPRWSVLETLDQTQLKSRWIELLTLINDDKISASTAYQNLIPKIISDPSVSVLKLAEEENLIIEENTGDGLNILCQEIIDANPAKVKAYKKGKKGLIGFFVGQAKRTGATFNPQDLNKEFERLLAS